MSNKKTPLSPADAVALLDLLTTDDTFRAAFKANPATALQQISQEAAAAASECSVSGELATVEQMTAARDDLIHQLTEQSVFSHPHCFIDGSRAPKA